MVMFEKIIKVEVSENYCYKVEVKKLRKEDYDEDYENDFYETDEFLDDDDFYAYEEESLAHGGFKRAKDDVEIVMEERCAYEFDNLMKKYRFK